MLETELRHALARCQKEYDTSAEEAFARLSDIPTLLLVVPGFPPDPVSISDPQVVDNDGQAALLRAEQKRWGDIEGVQWDDLTKAEKRAAAKLANFLGKGRSFRRQRPSEIDYPLALYLIFTLEDLLGRKVPYSRPLLGGSPRGPAFDALLAALHLTQWRKAIRAGRPAKSARPSRQALESIIKVTRSKHFDNLLQIQWLTRNPANSVGSARTLAHTIGLARNKGPSKRVRGTD
jgi:hypothetical protein